MRKGDGEYLGSGCVNLAGLPAKPLQPYSQQKVLAGAEIRHGSTQMEGVSPLPHLTMQQKH